MKKFAALLLTAVMALSLAACGEQPSQTTAAPATTAAPETTAAPTTTAAPETTAAPATTAAPTTTAAAAEGQGKIVVLNNAVADLKGLNEEPTTRYNAIWLKGWSVEQLAKDNFVQMPADDEKVSIVSWQDGYTSEDFTFGQLKNQYICLDAPAEGDLSTNNPEGFIFGLNVDKNALPWHIGWIKVGHEALVFMNLDGYEAQYLFEDLGMAAAESYDFICADDYSEEIYAADLEKVSLFEKDGKFVSSSIAFPEYTLDNIRSIQVHDLKADTACKENEICRLTVVNNAKGIVDEKGEKIEAPETSVLGGSVQTGYKVTDILDKYAIPAVDKVVYTIADGSTQEEAFDSFASKYLVTEDTKDRGAYVTGPMTPYGTTYKTTSIFGLGSNALVYVAKTFVQDAGMPVADVLKAMGISEFEEIEVVCIDGYSEVINAGDIADVFLFWVEDHVDCSSIAFPEYTLNNVETINVVGK